MKIKALAILATAGALSTFSSAAHAAEPIAPAPSPPPAAAHPDQLIVVSAPAYGRTRATLKAYEITPEHRRVAFGPWTARIGAHGFAPAGQKREGDDRTPSGTYGLQFMFGVSPNPGVRYPYRRVNPYDVWDDDPQSPLYNEWVDDRAQDPGVSPESMDVTPAYEYGSVIAYNLARTPDLGSAIFLHVNVAGARPDRRLRLTATRAVTQAPALAGPLAIPDDRNGRRRGQGGPALGPQPFRPSGRAQRNRPPVARRPFPCSLGELLAAQRPVSRRWRRCTVTIEKPIASRSTPAPIVQRRSKPVNGSVEALAVVGDVVDLLGTVLVVAGAVVFSGVLLSFDGDVPVVGVGVVVAGVVVGVVVGSSSESS